MNDFVFSNVGRMKKDQEQFHRDTTDPIEAISLNGKITREYLRMVLLPKDIVSFVPDVPPVDADVGTVSNGQRKFQCLNLRSFIQSFPRISLD